jgi:hypothetical protein
MMDRHGAVLSEIARSELRPQPQDLVLHRGPDVPCPMRGSRTPAPVDLVEFPIRRSIDPSLDGPQRHPVPARDLPQRHPGAHLLDHPTTPFLDQAAIPFLVTAATSCHRFRGTVRDADVLASAPLT